MLTEQDFLLDVLHLAPAGTVWGISSDSWEEIPRVFGDLLRPVPDRPWEWEVIIRATNKEQLADVIRAYELPLKVVHMRMTSGEGNTFFQGHDHLATIIVDYDFAYMNDLVKKYGDSELELLNKRDI